MKTKFPQNLGKITAMSQHKPRVRARALGEETESTNIYQHRKEKLKKNETKQTKAMSRCINNLLTE